MFKEQRANVDVEIALPTLQSRQAIFSWRQSFPVYRRVATMIFVPAESGSASTVEMVTIDPQDLQAAQELDLIHGA
jgi:hypothetical protein